MYLAAVNIDIFTIRGSEVMSRTKSLKLKIKKQDMWTEGKGY